MNLNMEESAVIEMAEAAGFSLAGKSEISANPKDTKDLREAGELVDHRPTVEGKGPRGGDAVPSRRSD